MMLTLFCDASHCSRTLAGGWGAWAKRDGWEFGRVFGGPLDARPVNSAEAELAAIAKALTCLAADGDLEPVKTIVLQSDSLAALSAVKALPLARWSRSDDKRDSGATPARVKLSKRESASLAELSVAIGARSVFLRHVKGHKSGTGRNWVNSQCDRVARKHMRALRSDAGEASP